MLPLVACKPVLWNRKLSHRFLHLHRRSGMWVESSGSTEIPLRGARRTTHINLGVCLPQEEDERLRTKWDLASSRNWGGGKTVPSWGFEFALLPRVSPWNLVRKLGTPLRGLSEACRSNQLMRAGPLIWKHINNQLRDPWGSYLKRVYQFGVIEMRCVSLSGSLWELVPLAKRWHSGGSRKQKAVRDGESSLIHNGIYILPRVELNPSKERWLK